MASTLKKRFEKFSTCFVNEFEMYIEMQRLIIEGETPANAKWSGIATNVMEELFNSPASMAGKAVAGIKDYLLQDRKLSKAGKTISLVNSYQNPGEKEKLRAMLVRVAYELFQSYEYQFMNAEKKQGGWSEAMRQLALTAVWCFMHYFKFNPQEQLNDQYVLEAVTLKNMDKVGVWKKLYYGDEKNFTKVTNTEGDVKWDGIKLYSKVGIKLLSENQPPVYYKNDLTKPEKYGFRRIFTHETAENIKREYKIIKPTESLNYEYELDLKGATKENMCQEILEEIKSKDSSLMEYRLIENIKRITQDIFENLMCEMMQQMNAAINRIAIPADPATPTSTVNNTGGIIGDGNQGVTLTYNNTVNNN